MKCSGLAVLLACIVASIGCGQATWPVAYNEREIYACGRDRVVLVNAEAVRLDPNAAVWSWRASDSPSIKARHHAWFLGMDDCKPVMNGSAVLVTSSRHGGVALIRRADKKCLFYAGGRNPHSGELIGRDLLVYADSYRGDHLRFYDLSEVTHQAKPVATEPLTGAHGVVWDRRRQVLWALGGRELLSLEVERIAPGRVDVKVVWRAKLPKSGGHDLFPIGPDTLAVTVNSTVFLFDVAKRRFTPMAELAGEGGVKSVSRNPRTGQTVYTRWNNRIDVLDGQAIEMPQRIYKARWNTANTFSYPPPPARRAQAPGSTGP